MRYEMVNGKIRDNYSGLTYNPDETVDLLNEMYRRASITTRDCEHSVELKAVNRMLQMENRFLTIKLQQLAWRGMLNINDIEKEIQDLCLNPQETSDYIHKFEKENFKLKQKLKELGGYDGPVI